VGRRGGREKVLRKGGVEADTEGKKHRVVGKGPRWGHKENRNCFKGEKKKAVHNGGEWGGVGPNLGGVSRNSRKREIAHGGYKIR